MQAYFSGHLNHMQSYICLQLILAMSFTVTIAKKNLQCHQEESSLLDMKLLRLYPQEQ